MNPLGGLLKLSAAAIIAFAWSRGWITPVILDTIGAFTTPRQPAVVEDRGAAGRGAGGTWYQGGTA